MMDDLRVVSSENESRAILNSLVRDAKDVEVKLVQNNNDRRSTALYQAPLSGLRSF
jgi:hypothetical protein